MLAENPHERLIAYFEKITSLTNDEKQLIREFFTPKTYRRKEFVLQENEICKAFNFVVTGCLRVYKVDDKGNYHILMFGTENWLVVDALSFREQSPSSFHIDALEKTEVLQISPENLKKLYLNAPKFNYIIRELLEKHLAHLQRRLLQNMYATAQDRYLDFCKTYPSLLNRISHTQIAYYLGITPEFLSKMRSQM